MDLRAICAVLLTATWLEVPVIGDEPEDSVNPWAHLYALGDTLSQLPTSEIQQGYCQHGYRILVGNRVRHAVFGRPTEEKNKTRLLEEYERPTRLCQAHVPRPDLLIISGACAPALASEVTVFLSGTWVRNALTLSAEEAVGEYVQDGLVPLTNVPVKRVVFLPSFTVGPEQNVTSVAAVVLYVPLDLGIQLRLVGVTPVTYFDPFLTLP